MQFKPRSEARIPATSSMPHRADDIRQDTRQHPRFEVSVPVTLIAGLADSWDFPGHGCCSFPRDTEAM
jgi:hypothetical protein